MPEELNLVKDLALILIAAGVFTVISKALKQPLILGYIVAGFLVGPHLGLFPSMSSAESVNQWSEIGIIFLLFSLGLDFSFKKLLKVGSSALITAATQCTGMFIVGLVAGQVLHFTTMESIFLGGLLSMSSTTIIIKAYDDLGLKNRPYASLIFGSLVFEDLIAILLMVLLSTMAVSNKFAGGEMLMGIGKMVFFIILWFLVGIYLIPSLLKWAKKYLSDEILLITAVGLCFGMVTIANLVGFSSALGAFVMGSILAETIEGERIEKLMNSIKNLFGAIFFVSVGMMVDPVVIGTHWLPVLILTLCAVIGILIFSTSGALIAGQGLNNSVHAGFSLCQLGEFSFIIAGLGCSLGVMRDFIYPVIIAVSVITTFTTPYMIKAADPVCRWLNKVLPEKVLTRINPTTDSKKGSKAEHNTWKSLLKNYFIRLLLYGVIIIAIIIGSKLFLSKLTLSMWPSISPISQKWLETGVTILVMIPFLYGMAVTTGSMAKYEAKLVKENKHNKWPLFSLVILRILLATIFVLVTITSRFELPGWAFAVVVVFLIALLMYARHSFSKISRLESKFFANLNEKEELAAKAKPITTSVRKMLAGYDIHLETVEISPDSDLIGKRLRELPLRHSHHVSIVKIQRGTKSIVIPSGDEFIYPHDQITVVGTTEFLSQFKREMDEETRNSPESTVEEFTVDKISLGTESFLTGKSLREVGMRACGCMVISVLRGEDFITNPKADFRFQADDIVWIAGEKKSCQWFE